MALATAHDGDRFAAFDSLRVEDLLGRGVAKWTFYPEDVLAAWVAEMDFATAPPIRAALLDAIERSATGYPSAAAASGLPEACAGWLARTSGLVVEPMQIQILPDALRAVELAIEVFSRPESAVVIPTPAYPPFFEAVRVVGRPIVEAPLASCGARWTFDLDAIGAALGAGAGTVILCNPHNPLGQVFTRRELAALAALVETHGARVVVDELHASLVYPGATHVSYATVSEAAARHSVTITSASKGWNLPGLKCAQIVLTNPADVVRWAELSFLRTYGASILGIIASRVAFEQGGPWMRDAVAYLDGSRILLEDLLARTIPQIGYVVPEATYLAWLDCRALALEEPAAFFLREARVALTDGAGFGAPGTGFVRLNFATSRRILEQIVGRMADAVGGR